MSEKTSKYSSMNEDELLELARDLRTRWDGHWQIDGRPIGAFEMHALSKLTHWEADQAIERDGCCGEITETGRCLRTHRMCPLFVQAQQINKRIMEEATQ